MPTVFLAHTNESFRSGLARELEARGFQVASHADIEAVLDAAGDTPPLALLVEPSLLDKEEFEVGTRLELRAGRAVPILALTHRASPAEMKTLRRHGAGLLSRPIEDVDRLAKQLSIQAAPWDSAEKAPEPAPAAPPAKPAGRGRSKAQPMVEIRETVGTPGGRRKRKRGAQADAPPPSEEVPAAPPPPMPPEVVAPLPESPVFTPPVASFGSILPLDAIPAAEVAPPQPRPAPEPPPWSKLPPPIAAPPPPRAAPPAPVTAPPPPAAAPIASAPQTTILPPEALPPANRTDVYFAPGTAPEASQPSDDYFGKPWAPPAAPPAPAQGPLPIEDLFAEPEPATEQRPVEANFQPVAGEKTELEEIPAKPAPTKPAAPDLMFADEFEEPTSSEAEAGDDMFADKVAEKTNIQDVAALRKQLEDPAPPRAESKPARNPVITISVEDTFSATVPVAADASEVAEAEEERTNLSDARAAKEAETSGGESAAEEESPFADREVEPTTQQPGASGPRETSVPGIQLIEGKGPSVLVVDDEPSFRGFLRDALASQGYQVHTAINAPNALRFLKGNRHVDLVISDLSMPHMDGFELKHEIDVWIGTAHKIPFIVVTADASAEKIEIAAQVGAAAIVPKPIDDLEAFFSIVEDTLRDAGVDLRGLNLKH